MQASAYVSQFPFLFEGTIFDNLTYGCVDLKARSDVRRALELAHAWQFVKELPGELDARFHPLRASLSGGQIQRLVIARALVLERPLLLFDEASSALDLNVEESLLSETFSLLQNERSSTKACLFVTHRSSLLDRFDEVIFMAGWAGRRKRDSCTPFGTFRLQKVFCSRHSAENQMLRYILLPFGCLFCLVTWCRRKAYAAA